MINQVIITGNLGRDPEIKYSASGMTIATFSVCFKSGKDKTGWINVVSFNKIADGVSTALHKGARVGIVGSLDQNSWTDKEGNNRSNIQLIANIIEYIKTDGRGFGENKNQVNNPDTNNNNNQGSFYNRIFKNKE